MFFGFLETVAGKASAVIDTTVALAGYLFLARTLQKIHALPSAGDLAEYQIGQCCPKAKGGLSSLALWGDIPTRGDLETSLHSPES